MPTLPNMGLITPTLGGDSGTWDDKINACFALIDAHDHTSGKGTQVPTAGIVINADMDYRGYGLTGVAMVLFERLSGPDSGVGLFRSAAGDDLWWRNVNGDFVQITDGAGLNISSLGGIEGDYASVGAQVAYDDANKTYTFKDQSSPSKKWTRLGSGPVRIYEYNTTESVYVELAVASALASSYSITLPAALPASDAFLQISASGVISYSNLMAITHLIPACAANSSQTAGGTPLSCTDGNAWSTTNGLNKLHYPISTLQVGSVISGYTVKISKGSDATNTITATLMMTDGISAAAAVSGFTATNAANAPGTVTLTITGQSRTVAANEFFFILVTGNDSTLSGTDSYGSATITHT